MVPARGLAWVSGCVAVPPAWIACTKVGVRWQPGAGIPKASPSSRLNQPGSTLGWHGQVRLLWAGWMWGNLLDLWAGCLLSEQRSSWAGGWVPVGPRCPGGRISSKSTVRTGEGQALDSSPVSPSPQRARPQQERVCLPATRQPSTSWVPTAHRAHGALALNSTGVLPRGGCLFGALLLHSEHILTAYSPLSPWPFLDSSLCQERRQI